MRDRLWRVLHLIRTGVSNPWIYPYGATQFGFMYYPIYELVGENIVRLRQASLLITFGLGWVLGWCFLQRAVTDTPDFQAGSRATRIALSALLAVPTLATFILTDLWMATPSYNTLNFQGFMVAMIGLMLASPKASPASYAGWVLIGVGGWLSFMAKPTSAAMLGLLVLAYLAAVRQFHWRTLLVSVATSCVLLVISALVIDGSLMAFVHRLTTSLAAIDAMGTDHTDKMFRLDEIRWSQKLKLNILLVTLVTGFSLYAVVAGKRLLGGTLLLVAMASALMSLAATLGYHELRISLFRFHGLQLWGLVFGVLLALVMLKLSHRREGIAASGWSLAALMLWLPYAYAFGTGNNYWQTAIGASVFWVLGASVLAIHTRPVGEGAHWKALTPLLAITLMLCVASLTTAMLKPYRQLKPLLTNTQPIRYLQGDATLKVSDRFAEYLTGLRAQAQAAGFKPGTPVIDLTGHSPGVLYFLGAMPVGQPWLLGGYPGSQDLAQFALDKVACDVLARSWLLLEADGPRALPDTALNKYGMDRLRDYYVVAKANNTHAYGWKRFGDDRHPFENQLLKPAHAGDTNQNCMKQRASR